MNRRQFTQSLAALFASPALPAKALIPAVQAPVSSLAICWADYLTKLHKVCTPEMLRPFLRVDSATAKAVHARLIAQNILTPSGTAHPDILRSRSALPKQATRAKTSTQPDKKATKVTDTPHTVRPVDPSEIGALAHIWHTSWHLAHAAHVPQTLTDQRDLDSFKIRLTDMIDNTRTIGPKGAPLGFYTLRGDELYQLFVAPEGHGTGIANTLINHAEARLRANGTTTAHLDCIPENARALAFYHRHGWQDKEETLVEVDTLNGPFELTCMVLTKTL